jgi:hypothetical protein
VAFVEDRAMQVRSEWKLNTKGSLFILLNSSNLRAMVCSFCRWRAGFFLLKPFLPPFCRQTVRLEGSLLESSRQSYLDSENSVREHCSVLNPHAEQVSFLNFSKSPRLVL